MTARAAHSSPQLLAQVDARIVSAPRGALTLAPDRDQANRLVELVNKLADPSERPFLAATAIAVAESQLDSFPDNIFWDFDFYLASIHDEASRSADYAKHLEQVAAVTVDLMRMYGQQSTIRFRYVHDFIYGFDWARWVRRGPPERCRINPFSLGFLKQVEGRGRDLLSLIEADDEVYPKLDGEVSRNPFPFFRQPEDELRLYRRMAAERSIPVEAWRIDASPDATRDFDALRERAAQSLGLRR